MQRAAEEVVRSSQPEGTDLPEGYIDDDVFGPAYLKVQQADQKRMRKQRVLGFGSLDHAMPLLNPSSVSSVTGGIDPQTREEIDSLRARELQRDEEARQLRRELQEQIQARQMMEDRLQERLLEQTQARQTLEERLARIEAMMQTHVYIPTPHPPAPAPSDSQPPTQDVTQVAPTAPQLSTPDYGIDPAQTQTPPPT